MRALILLLLPLLFTACRCGSDRTIQVKPEEGCVGEDCPAACVPYAEVCNGLDDDCDGVVDEDQAPLSCGRGACVREMPSCVDGKMAACAPGAPTLEVCNAIDDDCDGSIDEELLPTSCGVGECQQVVATCFSGVPGTCSPLPANAEQCDGLDNDCDGTVDEDLLSNISSDQRVTNNTAISDYVYAGWDGERFALTWQDWRDGNAQKGEIYLALLDRNGVRLQANDIRITHTTTTSTHPALDFNGTDYGLVYVDDESGSMDIRFQRVSTTGTLVGLPTPLTSSSGDADWPDIRWNGTAFGVAWADTRNGAEDIYFQLLDADGTPVGAEVRVTTHATRQQSPILKWNEDTQEWGLVWSDLRHGSANREIYFRRLAPDGTPVGNEINVSNRNGESSWPDVTPAGNGWGVAWQEGSGNAAEIYFASLSATGEVVGSEIRVTNATGFSGYPSIDWNGFQYGLSWQDERSGGKATIYFAALNAQGVKNGSDLRVSSGTGESTYTTALWNGTTFAFAWRDDRDDKSNDENTELYFAYVGCP